MFFFFMSSSLDLVDFFSIVFVRLLGRDDLEKKKKGQASQRVGCPGDSYKSDATLPSLIPDQT